MKKYINANVCIDFYRFFTRESISVINTVIIAITIRRIIFPIPERTIADIPNIAVNVYTMVLISFWVKPSSMRRKCRCVDCSHFIGFLPDMIRDVMTYTKSITYIPRTESAVAIFHHHTIASVAMRNASIIVPESPIITFLDMSERVKKNVMGIIMARIQRRNLLFS